MSKTNVDRKSKESKTSACETTASPCLFEGTFVSIAGSRLEVEDQHHKKASYALASDALLTCDGKVSKEGALKAGKKIRVTTQKGNPNMVTGIEWLNSNSAFPTPKTAVK